MEKVGNKGFVYEFGKFILDPEGRTLFSGGRPIHLPAKEFETLLLLVENNHKALSKEEMMGALWRDSFVEESNLAKQISRLRKILNSEGEQFIETLPKHGYRFSADLRLTTLVTEEPVILERRAAPILTFADENEIEDQPPAPPIKSKKWLRAPVIASLALTALLVLSISLYLSRKTAPPTEKIKSIAVLPLKPLTADEKNKVLGLGLADALITKLGSLSQIIVRPTSAVARFADAQADPMEIGRKLGVDAVLDGTILESEGRLRINARLIRTDNGMQLWAEKFDEPENEIFALQDDLSNKIAKTLAFELTNTENKLYARRGTSNTEAYEKYLRGRFYQKQNTPDGLNRSVEFYEQAIALDPKFAEAHAGIADANIIMFNFGFRPATETIPRARESVNRALQLDPNVSYAYTSLALIQFLIDHNWAEAEKSLMRAIELNPNNADAYHRYAYFLMRLGRFDESLQKAEKARELNPLSSVVQSGIGLTYLCARRYPDAVRLLEKTAAENPQFAHPMWLLGNAYEANGEAEKAFEADLKAQEIESGKEFVARLRERRQADGLNAASRFWLNELIRAKETGRNSSTVEARYGDVTALFVASRAAIVKDREQTIRWLERSLQEGDPTLASIRFLPRYDCVRDDPRFQSILQKTGY
jgi:TolB-like protein/DNA-binding winged helix-turn-helix (wHTH) protein/cytochrome c-type biogenesis protein CcmH/NrfG